jgi:hypothetical protein
MQKLVHLRRLPEGNLLAQLKFLQDKVVETLPWARTFFHGKSGVERSEYKRFMGLLASSFYLFSPQGRVQGIGDLRISQLDELLLDGFAQTTMFKTQSKWGYQPVTIDTVIVVMCNVDVFVDDDANRSRRNWWKFMWTIFDIM